MPKHMGDKVVPVSFEIDGAVTEGAVIEGKVEDQEFSKESKKYIMHIPKGQKAHIVDYYTTYNPAIDGYMLLYVNGKKKNIRPLRSFTLSSMDIHNPKRERLITSIPLKSNSNVEIFFKTTETGTHSNLKLLQRVYFHLLVSPTSGKHARRK